MIQTELPLGVRKLKKVGLGRFVSRRTKASILVADWWFKKIKNELRKSSCLKKTPKQREDENLQCGVRKGAGDSN